MNYAEVSVNSPIARERTFSYSIPAEMKVEPGLAVWVPFGIKTLQGIVVELTDIPAVEQTREIAGIIDRHPLITTAQINLARWMSSYYLAPLFDCIALMLPPAFERRVITYLTLTDQNAADNTLKPFLEMLKKTEPTDIKVLEKRFGPGITQKAVVQLLKQKLIERSYTIEKERVHPLYVPFIKLAINREKVILSLEQGKGLKPKQIDLLRFLLDNPGPQALTTIKENCGITAPAINTLVAKGWLEKWDQRVERDPLAGQTINLAFPLTLSSAQERAVQQIRVSLQADPTQTSQVFLLYGITGSGKTAIYLQALEETVKMGRKGLVLVPEIAMTPQIIERFLSRFPGRVAVLHSELKLGFQFDEWWRIQKGDFDVVIGPRSALFSPQPELGLIILDEEHEWTYKQDDNPRYNARDTAIKLGELCHATVILGSATPDIQSYQQALFGHYHLLILPERVTPGRAPMLPEVEIIDLRTELKAHNLSLFSRSLKAAMRQALQNREQIILFLNRRGSATFVECRNCGQVIKCKRCETPMSYHYDSEFLLCHRCNNHMAVPKICPRCHSTHIKYLGAGTEKLEMETAAEFPQARILRWDSDVLKEPGISHQSIFETFRSGEADILIGTQIIAKGLDLSKVTLVGVVNADVGLYLPDFRAAERTFQLLCQVAGRAGRGSAGGRVIIQTYAPQHYAIQCAARHDYLSFYKQELEYRRQLGYPPFRRLAGLTFAHFNDERCQKEAEKMRDKLMNEIERRGLADISLIGPAPAFIHRLRGKFRWQLIVRATNPEELLRKVTINSGWSVNIDPVGTN
jgi:primosomal protein N' (replication factor Y) (superfamily II helicase)